MRRLDSYSCGNARKAARRGPRRRGQPPGRALAARPIPNSELRALHFGDELNTKREAQKTYGSVLGTIFFAALPPPLPPLAQWLAAPNFAKNGENAKKSVIFSRVHPRFS